MLKKLAAASLILFAFISISFAASGLNMQEGLWEITTKTQMPGMDMPPMTHTQCLTKKDFVPQGSKQPGQECNITNVKVIGNTVTWSIDCESQGGKMKGTGKTTYSGNSFKGTMTMSMPQVNMNITSQICGRRIGDCK
jgi:hypothetical protein